VYERYRAVQNAEFDAHSVDFEQDWKEKEVGEFDYL
jgi:hypothetical protein